MPFKSKELQQIWLTKTKGSKAEYDSLRYLTNKSKLLNQHKIWRYNRLKNNPIFKLKCAIRTLVSISITRMGYPKNSKTEQILGCSFDEFRLYIERQFKPWMNWNNHGKWHLDHKIPISSANTEDEVINLNHYTNFQPLKAKDNLIKAAKFISNSKSM